MLLPHLGNQLEAQIGQRGNKVPHVLKPARHFCYLKKTSAIKNTEDKSQTVTLRYIRISEQQESVQFYPIFRTRLASARKSARLVPMSDRQKTAMSTEALPSGTCTGEERVCVCV